MVGFDSYEETPHWGAPNEGPSDDPVCPYELYLAGVAMNTAQRTYTSARVKRNKRKMKRRQLLALSVLFAAFLTAVFTKDLFQSCMQVAAQILHALKRGQTAEAVAAAAAAVREFASSVTAKKLLLPIFLTVSLRIARQKIIDSMGPERDQQQEQQQQQQQLQQQQLLLQQQQQQEGRGNNLVLGLGSEWPRRMQHSLSGSFLLSLCLLLPYIYAIACITISLIFLYSVNALRRMSSRFNYLYIQLLSWMLREAEKDPRKTATAIPFLWGSLFVLLLSPRHLSALCISLLSVGDPAAGVFRSYCRRRAAAAAAKRAAAIPAAAAAAAAATPHADARADDTAESAEMSQKKGLQEKVKDVNNVSVKSSKVAAAEGNSSSSNSSSSSSSKSSKNSSSYCCCKDNYTGKKCWCGFFGCMLVCAAVTVLIALCFAWLLQPAAATPGLSAVAAAADAAAAEAAAAARVENPVLRTVLKWSGLPYPWPSLATGDAAAAAAAAAKAAGKEAAAEMYIGGRLLSGEAASWVCLLLVSLVVGFVAAAAEAFPLQRLDDNILMPVACMVCFTGVFGVYVHLRGLDGAVLLPEDVQHLNIFDEIGLLLFGL